MQSPGKPRVFSGIQPSGGLHIGNYLGAIRNWVRDQDKYDNIFCIVDLHAITLPQDPAALRENTLDLAAMYLASGIKPDQAMFIQSHVPAHAELAWIFETFTPIGWLERMTQFKDRVVRQGRERIGAGIMTYPSLMAADIMLYDAKYVPVGEDQRQHIEYTRDIGQRINQRYGNILVIPEALIQKAGAEIKGLDNPEKKMSKSLGNTIHLSDTPEDVLKKVRQMYTDPKRIRADIPGTVEGNPVFIYHDAFNPDKAEVDDLKDRYRNGKVGDVEVKTKLARALNAYLDPIRERRAAVLSKPDRLREILFEGSRRARAIAADTMARVRHAVKISYT